MSPKKEKKGDLVDQMRRLSVGSGDEAFDFVSRAPSVKSMGSSNSAAEGGVMVGLDAAAEVKKEEGEGLKKDKGKSKAHASDHSAESSRATGPSDTASSTGNSTYAEFSKTNGSKDNTTTKDNNDAVGSTNTKATTSKDNKPTNVTDEPASSPQAPASSTTFIHCSPFWMQYRDFVPNASATFKSEFKRLASQRGWAQNGRTKNRVAALESEIAFYWDIDGDQLKSLQQLCRDVDMEKIPTSVTQCKKALKSRTINIWNLIDHRRNPQAVPIIEFKNYREFCQYTRKKGRRFPKQCAKSVGVLKVLLKEI